MTMGLQCAYCNSPNPLRQLGYALFMSQYEVSVIPMGLKEFKAYNAVTMKHLEDSLLIVLVDE